MAGVFTPSPWDLLPFLGGEVERAEHLAGEAGLSQESPRPRVAGGTIWLIGYLKIVDYSEKTRS